MNIFKKLFRIKDKHLSLEDVYDILIKEKALPATLHDITFENYIEAINGDLTKLKLTEAYVIEDLLKYARVMLYHDKIQKFGISKGEISIFKINADIATSEWKYANTGHKKHYINAHSKKLRLPKPEKTHLGSYAKMMFELTGKTHKLNEISAFEGITILNSSGNGNRR